jgi:uncharacterized protein (TIGR03083 family)
VVVRLVGLDEARSLVEDAFATVRDQVAGIPADRLGTPSVLDGWTVRDLLAHLARALDAVAAVEPAPPRSAATSLADYLAGYPASATAIAETTRRLAAEATDLPSVVLDTTWSRVVAHLDRLGPTAGVVAGRRGAIRLTDLLLTRVLELVVHSDDLARSLGTPTPTFSADVERAAVRTLLDALAARHPGQAVEVRVPPYAAVQCVEGPRHTRGTPPNVVELDPSTWIRLAAGRVDWDDARRGGGVRASGARADLSGLLPVL